MEPKTAVAKEIMARAEKARRDRSGFDAFNNAIRHYIRPDGKAFGVGGATSRARPRAQDILDNTGEDASDDMAAWFYGMLMNPATRWVQLSTQSPEIMEDEEASLHLQRASEKIMDHFGRPASGFAVSMQETIKDWLDYGEGGAIGTDQPGIGPYFETRAPQEVYYLENAKGQVDTGFRFFTLTARQAMQEFAGKPGTKVAEAAASETKQDDEFQFLHALYPRPGGTTDATDPKKMAHASVYISIADAEVVRESGTPIQRFAVSRLSKPAGSKCGRGLGAKALGDIMTLQRATKNWIEGGEIANHPPALMADDGILGNVKMYGGAVNVARAEYMMAGRSPLVPYTSGVRPEVGDAMVQRVQERIKRAYKNHLIHIDRDPRLTATQVLEEAEQVVRVIGPFAARWMMEMLNWIVSYSYFLMARDGMFGPEPEILSDQKLTVEFVSPFAKAIKLAQARGVLQLHELTAPILQFDPDAADNLDADKAFRGTAKIVEVPHEYMRSERAVKKRRDDRQQARAAQAQMAQIAEMAKAAGAAAPAIEAAGGGDA